MQRALSMTRTGSAYASWWQVTHHGGRSRTHGRHILLRGVATSARAAGMAMADQAHFQARLHAQLAAFASEPSWQLTRLQLTSRESDEKLLRELTAEMGLEVAVSADKVVEVTKTARGATGSASLVDACDFFGPRPLALLLAEPLLDPHDEAKADDSFASIAGARNVSLLVRELARHRRTGPMLDALDEATSSPEQGLLAHQPSSNAAVAAVMRRLTSEGRTRGAFETFEAGVAAGVQPDSFVLLQLCVAAQRSRAGRNAMAAKAVERVTAEVQSGTRLGPPAVDAYLDCCALAGAVAPALAAFEEGLDGYSSSSSSSSQRGAAAADSDGGGGGSSELESASASASASSEPNGRRRDEGRKRSNRDSRAAQLHRLCAVLTACGRAGDVDSAKFARALAKEHRLRPDLACTNAWIMVLGRSRPRQSRMASGVLHRLLRRGSRAPTEACMRPEGGGQFWLPPADAVSAAVAQHAADQHDADQHAFDHRAAGRHAASAASTADPLAEPTADPGYPPDQLRVSLNIAIAACARQPSLVFGMLRDAATFGVTPDVIGLTAAVRSCGAHGELNGHAHSDGHGHGHGAFGSPHLAEEGGMKHLGYELQHHGRADFEAYPTTDARGGGYQPVGASDDILPEGLRPHEEEQWPPPLPEEQALHDGLPDDLPGYIYHLPQRTRAAAALVRWGVELGIEADTRYMEAVSMALPPEAVGALLENPAMVDVAPRAFGAPHGWSSYDGAAEADQEEEEEQEMGVTSCAEGATPGPEEQLKQEVEKLLRQRREIQLLLWQRRERQKQEVQSMMQRLLSRLLVKPLLAQSSLTEAEARTEGRAASSKPEPRSPVESSSMPAALQPAEPAAESGARPPKLLTAVEAIARRRGMTHRAADLLEYVQNSMKESR